MPVFFGQNAIADAARSLENLLTAKIRVNIAGLRAIATETATRGHPIVRAMADPNFARLAHDDVKPLTGIEKAVGLAFPAYDDDTLWNKAGHLIPFNGLVNLVQGAAGNRRGDTQNSYVGNEAQGLGRFVAGLGELADVYGRYRRDMAAAGFANFGPRDARVYDTTAGTRTVAPLANALKARGQDLTSRVSKATPVTKAGGLAGNVVRAPLPPWFRVVRRFRRHILVGRVPTMWRKRLGRQEPTARLWRTWLLPATRCFRAGCRQFRSSG